MDRSPTSALAALYLTQATITVILNVLSIIVFWRRRANLKRACYFLVNLVVADTLVGVAQFTSYFFPPTTHLHFSEVFVSISISASLFSLILISLERLFAIWKPLRHRVSAKKNYFIAISFLWVLSAANGVLWMIYSNEGEARNVVVTWILVAFFAVILCIIVYAYTAIWYMVVFRPRPLHHNREQNKKLTKTLFIVTALSLLTWIPAMVGTLVDQPLPSRVYFTVSTLLFGNSLLNPIVYIFRMQEFRDEIKRLLCGVCQS